jgi:hypothetical protein
MRIVIKMSKINYNNSSCGYRNFRINCPPRLLREMQYQFPEIKLARHCEVIKFCRINLEPKYINKFKAIIRMIIKRRHSKSID